MVSRLVRWVRHEPALVAALALAVTQAAAVPEAWQKVVLAALSLLAGTAVRSQVSPTAP